VSYIVARVVDQNNEPPLYGFTVDPIDFRDRTRNALDNNLDDEILDFVLGVVRRIDDLEEGQALVIWKEIF
jgi:hypothetical protein